jgi:protein-S-isoprenylcysteine O-methyltransferase Ste14
MGLVNLKPPLIACLLLALSVGLHFVLPQAYRRQFACVICGVIAIAIGVGVLMWAWGLFRKSGTPTRPNAPATALITTGPFRFSRNPMYLAIVVMMLGLAVWVGSLPMLIAPVGFFAFMSLVFIPYEERRLRETFGAAYVSFTQRVRRWI